MKAHPFVPDEPGEDRCRTCGGSQVEFIHMFFARWREEQER